VNEEQVLAETQHWIDDVVIGLELCPFAKRSVDDGRLRIHVSGATSPAELLVALESELAIVKSAELDSSLIVHPNVLTDFLDFNDFLSAAEAAIIQESLAGEIQIASFHPDYRFEGTAPDAIENYTNRSPYPMLHLLREDAVSLAVESHPDPHRIPARNIARLEQLGWDELRKRLDH
jgi:hypothetical protein